VRAVKPLTAALLLALAPLAPSVARGDVGKPAPAPRKLDREARVFIVEKEAPPLDKTIRLAHAPRSVLKDK
jgi:hypothetical protein